ncbi:unnamed protein product, partial [Porites evermanni]
LHQRQGFVKSLELGDEFPFGVGKDQRYVADGSLASFVKNLTGQQKQDVLNSTLLAQLAASKKFDRQKETTKWYDFYKYVLENVGWVIQSFQFQDYQTSNSSFKLSEVTLEILGALVEPEAEIMKVVKATIDSLAKSKRGIALFDSGSTSGRDGNFQIMPCTLDQSQQITLALMAFKFNAHNYEDDFFFFTWGSGHIELHYATQTCTLNEDVYSQVRQDIIKKLGKRAHTFVENLDF